MRILWVKADKLLPVCDDGGNIRTFRIRRRPETAARYDGSAIGERFSGMVRSVVEKQSSAANAVLVRTA
jgi:hypothetical protein